MDPCLRFPSRMQGRQEPQASSMGSSLQPALHPRICSFRSIGKSPAICPMQDGGGRRGLQLAVKRWLAKSPMGRGSNAHRRSSIGHDGNWLAWASLDPEATNPGYFCCPWCRVTPGSDRRTPHPQQGEWSELNDCWRR